MALNRNALQFALYTIVCTMAFWHPLGELLHVSLSSETSSHILLIPFISLGLIFIARKRIFACLRCSATWSIAFFLVGALVCILHWKIASSLSGTDSIGLSMLSLLLFCWSGFLFCFGSRAFLAGLFPLLFLLFMVPLPSAVLNKVTLWLQGGSAAVVCWIFQVTGTPVLQDNLVLTVPGMTIEVAQDCSGIRSALALLITCLVAGYLLLHTRWTRLVFFLSVLPVLVIKNGIRIASLALLATDVDSGFLTGGLHRKGGFLFLGLGLLILTPILKVLQAFETRLCRGGCRAPSPPHLRTSRLSKDSTTVK